MHRLLACAVAVMAAASCHAEDVSLSVGMIKFQYDRYASDPAAAIAAAASELRSRIQAVCAAHADCRLITTAEYSLYPRDSESDTGLCLRLNAVDGGYAVDADTSWAPLAAAVGELQTVAQEQDVWLLLGTVAEAVPIDQTLYPAMPALVVSNTLLIIDPRGAIVDIDRKVRGSDWCNPYPEPGSDYESQATQVMNASSRVRELSTRSGHRISYFPIICAERTAEAMLQAVADAQVPLLIEVEREGDLDIEDLAEHYRLNPGVDHPRQEDFFDSYWRQPYTVTHRIIRSDGCYLKNDSAAPQAAAVYFDQRAPEELVVGDQATMVRILVPALAPENGAPVVASTVADPAQPSGSSTSLSTSASDPNGDPISYRWTVVAQPDGAAAVVEQPTAAATTVSFDRAGSYRFRVSVSDGVLESTDEVVVQVQQTATELHIVP